MNISVILSALLRSQLVQIWKHCLFENISRLLASKSTQPAEFEQRDGDFFTRSQCEETLKSFNFQLICRTSPDEPIRGKQSVVSFYNFMLLTVIKSYEYMRKLSQGTVK